LIKRAFKSYERLIRKLAEDVALTQPWKVSGRQWHLSQSMVAKTQPRLWTGALIVELLGRIKKAAPEIIEDWTRKVMVVLNHPRVPGVWGRLVTNHADALRVEIRCGRGQFTPAMVERLGIDVDIRQLRANEDQVRFWLQKIEQCDPAQLERLVRGAVEQLCATSPAGSEE